MILYADTSVLVKCYLEEPGSTRVREYLESAQLRVTSALTQLELVAAIECAKRMRRINSPNYRTQIAAIQADVGTGTLSLLDIYPPILKRALSLIRLHKLRSPDAIQLATALDANKRSRGAFYFLCADRPLLTAASKEGLRCRDVSS